MQWSIIPGDAVVSIEGGSCRGFVVRERNRHVLSETQFRTCVGLAAYGLVPIAPLDQVVRATPEHEHELEFEHRQSYTSLLELHPSRPSFIFHRKCIHVFLLKGQTFTTWTVDNTFLLVISLRMS